MKINDARLDLESLNEIVVRKINELTDEEIEDIGVSDEELKKREKRKADLQTNIRLCGVGDVGAKDFVEDVIQNILIELGVNEKYIDNIIAFKNPKKLTTQEQFDILLFKYKEKFKSEGLKKFITEYGFDKLRESEIGDRFFVSKEDIEKIYIEKSISLTYEEKLEILTQRVYRENYGLSVIEELLEQNVSGLSCGVSGLPESYLPSLKREGYTQQYIDNIPKSYDSVWLYYQRKEIHLEFMSFGSYSELRRVCELAYRFNDPPQLSQAKPYIFNTTASHYRVSVYRPEYCETWVVIFRQFNVNGNLKKSIVGEEAENILLLNEFIVKGGQNIFISGPQGSGKTTYLKGVQELVPLYDAIRGSEDFFEIHGRALNPKRNMMYVQDVPGVTREEAQDSLKKSNGTRNVIGESASAMDIGYISQVSPCTKQVVTTVHTDTMDDCIRYCRNSLMSIGLFNDAKIAEEEAVSFTHFNIRLRSNFEDGQGILSIEECVPIEQKPYKTEWRDKDKIEEKLGCFLETALQYFEKKTDLKQYEVRTIVQYDTSTGRYYFPQKISEKRRKNMERNMLYKDKIAFRKFCDNVLGRDKFDD